MCVTPRGGELNQDPFKNELSKLGQPTKPKSSLDEIFVKRKMGGSGRRSVLAKPIEPEERPEPMEIPLAPSQVEKGLGIITLVTLRNPQWLDETVGFNQETRISVEVEIDREYAHLTKINFTLFANTPGGVERISQGEGTTVKGKAIGSVPIFIPAYRDADGNPLRKVDYFFFATHSLIAPAGHPSPTKTVNGMAERVIKSHIIQNVTFTTNKCFLSPDQSPALKAMCTVIGEWRKEHPSGKLALFGHTDAVGTADPNKKLAERRARSLLGFLLKAPEDWEVLYQEDKWGLASTQDLLRHLGHDPGPSDGVEGPKTKAAIKDFQAIHGLPMTGDSDSGTRKVLYRAYMEKWNGQVLDKADFDDINGSLCAGCGEYNLFNKTQGSCAANRRVAVFLLRSSKNFPVQYPCKKGDSGPCKSQLARKGARRTSGFGCLFYDQLVVETSLLPQENDAEIVDFGWKKSTILPMGPVKSAAMISGLLAEASPAMTSGFRVKTLNLLPRNDAVVELFQYSGEGKHTLVKRFENLRLEGDALLGPEGKEFEIGISHHDGIYDYGRTQYFAKLKAGTLERATGWGRDELLRLIHQDSVIANSTESLGLAQEEGEWVANYLHFNGPWKDGTNSQLFRSGHEAEFHGSEASNTWTKERMSLVVSRNRFLHHQVGHGLALCYCTGHPKCFLPAGINPVDGVHEEACPACKKSANGIGALVLSIKNPGSNSSKMEDLIFYLKEDVEKVSQAPSVVFIANCCTTAVTPAFAEAWIAKGTRWYIGWGVAVNDDSALFFAKAFYHRWMEYYKMDPDDVRKAFNDVKSPYEQFRPRIFGT